MPPGKRTAELITPPLEYECDYKKQKEFGQIKKEVINSFLERTKNTIKEKITHCLEEGLSLDQTYFIITGAIQALSLLMPLQCEEDN